MSNLLRESPGFPDFPPRPGQFTQNSAIIIADLSSSPAKQVRDQGDQQGQRTKECVVEVRMDLLSGQQLLGKDEKVVSADTVLQDKRIIAFYFSAHWCPPCRWSWSENMDTVITLCHSQPLHSHPR